MKQFAKLLNTLYFTYSHLDKMTLLEQFFTQTSDPERGYALAIMAGDLTFPTFKRSIIKELIEDKVDPVLFALSYDYVGDISETVALLWPEPKNASPLPLLSEVIKTFNELPVKSIKYYLEDLLNKSNLIERWALLKLGTGSLRIGISSRFLKNTLARYGRVDVQDIEKIWHGIAPPYLNLFSWLEKKTTQPVMVDLIHFHPVMLSHPLDEKILANLNLDDFVFERKYDGIRVQIVSAGQDKVLFTRTGDDISHSFPDVLDCIHGNVILDGELVIQTSAGVGSFNDLQQRLNRKTVNKKLLNESPAAVILYDLLSVDQHDLREKPFMERHAMLIEWMKTHPAPNRLLSELLTKKPDQSLAALKAEVLSENNPAVEGLMIKQKNSPYLAGRPKGYWFKWKRDPLTVDAVLMYAQRGSGKRSSFYSDYTFGLWQNEQLLPIGKAYFGFTDEELLQLDRWIRHNTINRFGPVREVKKELIFEVAFDAVHYSSRHKSGVALRFPRISRIRWDKPPSEADTLDNLIKLI